MPNRNQNNPVMLAESIHSLHPTAHLRQNASLRKQDHHNNCAAHDRPQAVVRQHFHSCLRWRARAYGIQPARLAKEIQDGHQHSVRLSTVCRHQLTMSSLLGPLHPQLRLRPWDLFVPCPRMRRVNQLMSVICGDLYGNNQLRLIALSILTIVPVPGGPSSNTVSC